MTRDRCTHKRIEAYAPANGRKRFLLCLLALGLAMSGRPASFALATDGRETMKILTFNLWHGLARESSTRLVSLEPPDHQERRMQDFLQRVRRDPVDLIFLQEANPAGAVARRLSLALEMDEIHKVCNAGLKLVVGLPPALKSGLAILARRDLGLERVGSLKLPDSGPCWCGDTVSFQVREHRYALVGRIEWDGRTIILVCTHLHHTRPLDDETRSRLTKAVYRGEISQRDFEKIVRGIDDRVARRARQARALVAFLEQQYPDMAVILAGDFNAEPGSPAIQEIVTSRGFLDTYAEKGKTRGYTWDPSRNPNARLGPRTGRKDPYADGTVAGILKARDMRSRRIDYVFLNDAFARDQVISSRLFAAEPMPGGLYCSDHFGVLTTIALWK